MKKFTYHLGNIFIAFSFFILLFIYYPIIWLTFFPPNNKEILKNYPLTIEIPKIKVASPIILNVDPFNDTAYHTALTHGVAQAKGTAIPGEKGTMYLFAHSSDFPWRITRYNTVFFRLGELNNNDIIYINNKTKRYTYKVFDKKVVWPNEVSYLLEKRQKNQLIVQTCTPVGTSLQRLLVFAKPI